MITHAKFVKALAVVNSFKFKCCKCSHKWTPTTDRIPKKCPAKACKSPNWNRPR